LLALPTSVTVRLFGCERQSYFGVGDTDTKYES
jgi:hypothetical protein